MRLVLRQPAIAGLAVAEQVLDHMKGMLNLRPDARLELLEPILQPPQFVCRQGLAHAALHRHQPFDGLALVLGTFLDALVTRISEHRALLAMQQGVGLAHVAGVGGRRDQRMHQPRLSIDANVRLHAELPVVTLLGLVHLRVARLGLVLCRGWGRNQRGIDDRPFTQDQALFGQMGVDRLEDLACEPVRFEQTSEFQQGGRIRCRLPRQINPHEAADRLTVVQCVPSPRRTARSTAGPRTCAASATDRSAAVPGPRPSGRTARSPPPTPPTAWPRGSRQESGRAASASSSRRTPGRKSSIASVKVSLEGQRQNYLAWAQAAGAQGNNSVLL